MREAGIGRVLVASLHQGIADVLPTRLEFYESWLSAEGLRGGTIGMGPLNAVLSFLRQEGPAYPRVTNRAGECAAEWFVQAMSPFQRASIGAAPPWLRTRLVLRVARHLMRESYRNSWAVAHVRRGRVRLDLHNSIFCLVREPVAHPLCGFYAAAFGRLFELFGMPVRAEVGACRGTGESSCILALRLQAEPVAGAESSTSPPD